MLLNPSIVNAWRTIFLNNRMT